MRRVPEKREIPQAERIPAQPVIEPRNTDEHWWERNGTFNPGVTEYNGQVVLLYRAYDDFRISRLGLAHSKDGINFTRYDHPAIDTDPNDAHERLGIEDPRITKIGDTYYIVHTAASYHSVGAKADVTGAMDYIPWRVRVAMHTTKDFRTFIHHGVILPDVAAKNACLLPEKIHDRFAMYYRELTPKGNIMKIGYTDDFGKWEKSEEVVWPELEEWQAEKVGFSSQPIITDGGLLVIYHAVDMHHTYRMGLAMFDREDPAQLVWYSPNPFLQPEMPYEKEGFIPNVVYSCGALLRNKELWVYYGAGDKVIGRAILSLGEML